MELEAAASDVGVRVRRLDKKGEKAAASALRERLLGQLAACEDAPLALTLALPLVALRSTGVYQATQGLQLQLP